MAAILPLEWDWRPWYLGVVQMRLRTKALRSGTGGGDASGCCIPLGGAVVVPLPVPGLWVKTLVRHSVSAAAARSVVTLLGGVFVELRYLPVGSASAYSGKL